MRWHYTSTAIVGGLIVAVVVMAALTTPLWLTALLLIPAWVAFRLLDGIEEALVERERRKRYRRATR